MPNSDQDQKPPVVVIGAGPTGLALAIELGSRAIPCVVLERSERGGFSPRAKTTHVRTRELMRRWGIADDLARASPFGIDYPTDIYFVTRLSGLELVRFPNALNCSPKRDERYSEHGQWIPQYKLEEVLRRKAQLLSSVQIVFEAEFVGYEQGDEGVTVRYKHQNGEDLNELAAVYVVGADGARSLVRDSMGARMLGTHGLSRSYNIIFHAPGLAEAHPHGPGIMYWQINSDVPSVISPMDTGDIWAFGPTAVGPDYTLSDEEAIALIKRATGIDLPYRILSCDAWVASRLLADRYRDRRVFLAGDACHLHPPFGGFGMNMGIADAVDIGWKLAAVLEEWGGPALLDSYEMERRPVHELVMDEAESNHAVLANQLFRDGIEEESPAGEQVRAEVADLIRETKAREFYALGVVLGLRYRGSPVIPDDGTEWDWTMSRDYIPSAAPGSLAPHGWLDDGSSLYDRFGPGFTLLVLADAGADDIALAALEAAKTHTPLTVVELNDKKFADLYQASRALIRPDQIVAWRGTRWPTGLLDVASGRVPDTMQSPPLGEAVSSEPVDPPVAASNW